MLKPARRGKFELIMGPDLPGWSFSIEGFALPSGAAGLSKEEEEEKEEGVGEFQLIYIRSYN